MTAHAYGTDLDDRTGTMHVSIDLDKCAGHARCYAIDPELFDIDDSGYALNGELDVPEDRERAAREAIANCPERAITAQSGERA